MPNRRVRSTLLVQDCARKSIPVATRLTPAAVAEIEAAARALGISRHRVLLSIFRLGTPLAIAELTAKTATAAGGEE